MPPTGHLILASEVPGWLVDSVNKAVTYHRTTRAAAQDILEHGVDVARSRIGSYGQGFYTATDPGAFPGDATLAVAIRTRHPLVGELEEIADQIDAIARVVTGSPRITPAVSAAIRRELVRVGYDGIVVRDAGGDGIDYVVALDSRTVKVIQP